MTRPPVRILFVSQGNAARSQMAEGWARTLAPSHVVVRSGGVRPRHLHPLATRVMQEAGVDISSQRGKSVEGLARERFDVVVTLCETAVAEGPAFPHAARTVHRPFEDPTLFESGDDGDLETYRALRDELRAVVEEIVEEILRDL